VWVPREMASKLLSQWLAKQTLLRVRVTLKGHQIWSQQGEQFIYLDGQAFGKPGLRREDQVPRIDLQFPSGNCARASDFESWFYIGRAAPPQKTPLQVQAVRFFDVQGKEFPAKLNKGSTQPTVKLNQEPPIAVVLIEFNRAVNPQSISPNSVRVMRVVENNRVMVPAKRAVSGNEVKLTVGKPLAQTGSYELLAAGTENKFSKPATIPVQAQDDNTALDGDYSNEAGGNFVLPLVVGKP